MTDQRCPRCGYVSTTPAEMVWSVMDRVREEAYWRGWIAADVAEETSISIDRLKRIADGDRLTREEAARLSAALGGGIDDWLMADDQDRSKRVSDADAMRWLDGEDDW